MQPLIEGFGNEIKRYDLTLIRRFADLEDSKQYMILLNGIKTLTIKMTLRILFHQ